MFSITFTIMEPNSPIERRIRCAYGMMLELEIICMTARQRVGDWIIERQHGGTGLIAGRVFVPHVGLVTVSNIQLATTTKEEQNV